MREQLETLVERAAQPNVDLQLLPFKAGAHPAINSTFTLLHFREDVPDVVYVEGLLGEHYLEARTDIERYRRIFDQLRATALSPRTLRHKSRRSPRRSSTTSRRTSNPRRERRVLTELRGRRSGLAESHRQRQRRLRRGRGPHRGSGVAVRDSKDPNGPVLHYTDAEWRAFLHGARNGEFDL